MQTNTNIIAIPASIASGYFLPFSKMLIFSTHKPHFFSIIVVRFLCGLCRLFVCFYMTNIIELFQLITIFMRENSIWKERILQYLEHKGVTKYEFYKKTGVSNGVLSQKNGLSEDNAMKFLSYYDDVNPEWFATGKGEMLKQYDSLGVASDAGVKYLTPADKNKPIGESNAMPIEYYIEVAENRSKIADLLEQNCDLLKENNNLLKEKIKQLENKLRAGAVQ